MTTARTRFCLFLISTFHAWMMPAMCAATEHRAANAVEFKEILKKVQPGDTIILANGNWRDADLLFRANGTASQPITLRTETPGQVILCGASRLHIGGSHLIVDGLIFRDGGNNTDAIEFRTRSDYPARHCRVTNCAIMDYNPPNPAQENKWVQIYGEHNRVDHCWFSGKTTRGTLLVVWLSDQPNHNVIAHNYFGRRPEYPKNGAEVIRIGDSDSSMQNSRSIVECNYFEECDGEIETISNKSCENIFRCNTFVRCKGTLTLRHGNRCRVEGNYFFGEGVKETGGVRVIGEDHRVVNNYFADLGGYETRSAISIMNGLRNSPLNGHFQVKRAAVAFNTFFNCRCPIEIGSSDDNRKNMTPEDCIIANNLIVGNKGAAIIEKAAPVRMIWQGNQISGMQPGVEAAGGLIADPRLERGNDGLQRLSAGSPAIGAAIGLFDHVVDDLDGQPRGKKKDAGCDQYSTTPIVRKPMTAQTVGPLWMRGQEESAKTVESMSRKAN